MQIFHKNINSRGDNNILFTNLGGDYSRIYGMFLIELVNRAILLLEELNYTISSLGT